jgi:serine O-acetyltransferase
MRYVIDSRTELRRFIAADLAAHGLRTWRPHYRLTQRPMYFQWLLRRSEYWANCRRDPLGRLVFVWLAIRAKLLGERLGFTVPRNTTGPGLALRHVGTVVVNYQARIGARCTISHGVTIGADDQDRSPVLGDGVHISPNACVIGGITVGDNVGVWTGAVVTRDVPSNVSVAGVPARIVKQDVPT